MQILKFTELDLENSEGMECDLKPWVRYSLEKEISSALQ